MRWTTDLSVKMKPINFLEKNIGECFYGPGLGNDFLGQNRYETLNNKLDDIKLKSSAKTKQKTYGNEGKKDKLEIGRKYNISI